MTPSAETSLGFAALDPCVHCGFCLPACPTYLATGDENDSPRGRIVLMRALEQGDLPATDPDLRAHLDACLGCRGCEPACPSGVGYGEGLAEARKRLAKANGIPAPARLVLAVMGSTLRRPVLAMARVARRMSPRGIVHGRNRVSRLLAQLRATRPTHSVSPSMPAPAARTKGRVALFRGCVMDGLFRHVHEATIRVLAANGWETVEIPGFGCCGALHAHAGDRAGADRLARANAKALEAAGALDAVVLNSAGCGAHLRELPHLVDSPGTRRLAGLVRDVTELLARDGGPRPGGALPMHVAYDPPCHLQHAQGVHAEVLAMLGAIPDLTVHTLPGASQCCGSAGLHGLLHPQAADTILEAKLAPLLEHPEITAIVTGNPGCLMQIGGGLVSRGSMVTVVHPVELLDRSYAAAGLY